MPTDSETERLTETRLKTETIAPRTLVHPASIATLVDLLRLRAREQGEDLAYLFLDDGEREGDRFTWSELDRRARQIAATLQACSLQTSPPENRAGTPERALLLYPPGLDFIAAFFGCLYAGVLAVPTYPPHGRKPLARLAKVLENARPRFALTIDDQRIKVERALKARPNIEILTTDALHLVGPTRLEDRWQDLELRGDDLAFLQYTSGSTSAPRGVEVSHANLLHNQALIGRAFGHLGADGAIARHDVRVVGWLPLFHDMGLIGNVLHPLFLGSSCVLMSPVAFLQRPLRWLRAIARYGRDGHGIVSGGPNFAYEQCWRKIDAEDRERLDLRPWRVAYNGAEPIRAETLDRFADAFAASGFDRRAFFPCYGLAEATLFVSGGPDDQAAPVLEVETAALERHEIVEARPDDGADTRRLVSSGRVWSDLGSRGQEVAIVDPASAERRPDGRVGEIWIRGGSVARGYFERDSEDLFAARLRGEEPGPGFLRTGDLGFFHRGELFVTGRVKELIILRGRNHYPQDLELSAESAHSALRPGCGAAFGVEIDGEEQLVIAFELDRRREAEAADAAAAIRSRIAEEHEVQAYEVALLRLGGVPKTSSGKIQRTACRAALLAGDLPVVLTSRLDTEAGPREVLPSLDREALLALETAARREALLDHLRAAVARAARRSMDEIAAHESPQQAGLDSLGAIELQAGLETDLGVRLPMADLLGGLRLDALAEQLAGQLHQANSESGAPTARPPANHETLSPGQRALWFLERLSAGSGAYHIAVAARVPDLDADAFERALRRLSARHSALRSAFAAPTGEPLRREATAPLDFAVDETAADPATLSAEARRPFDLERGPLLRTRLFTGGDTPRVLLVIHHLIADFWSLAVFARELATLYREARGGARAVLETPPHYAEHVRDLDAWLASADGQRSFDYWRQDLQAELPELDLPTDRRRPATQSFDGATVRQRIRSDVWQRLEALAERTGATPFAALLTAYAALLRRLSGQDEVVIGTPTVGRRGTAHRHTIGYFVNPVALRLRADRATPFTSALEAGWRKAVAAFEHQDVPFPHLVERLVPSRDASRSPLFQAMFVYQSAPPGGEALIPFALGEDGPATDLGGLVVEPVAVERDAAQFDLSLYAAPLPQTADGLGRHGLGQHGLGRHGLGQHGLAMSLEYSTALFDDTTARRLVGYLARLIEAAVDAPNRRLDDLPLLSAAEHHQLSRETSPNDDLHAQAAQTLHGLFRRAAERGPEAIALVNGHSSLTYDALAQRIGERASELRQLGAGPETRVAVCAGRGFDLVTAILAVLDAGAAYVPLDPAYPRERIAFVLEDAGAPLLLTESRLAETLADALPEGTRTVRIDEPPLASQEWSGSVLARPETDARQLAYVIYTSGSTGRPKGVMIEHRQAVAMVAWARETFSPRELERVMAATSICFDLSIFELFVPLSGGHTVIVAENALALPELGHRARPTLVNTVPSAMAELVRFGPLPPSVRTVNLAGEPLKGDLVRRVLAAGSVARVWNLYGPSEDTTYSTGARMDAGYDLERDGEPTLGRAIRGGRALLLDRSGQPVPRGVRGELLLGGDGVTRGYFARPGRTASRYVPAPDFASRAPGERLYRTGDLGRVLANGEIEFLGRLDHQVKIRGFRIELGEIEAALAACDGVQDVVVLAPASAAGEPRLVAYVESPGSEPTGRAEALRHSLASRLPAFLVPSLVVVLDAMPRTPNGKIDRRRLPAPDFTAAEANTDHEPPRGALEELVARLWSTLLDRDRIGRQDNFFALGGHSLLAARLAARVRDALDVELPLATVFEAPTLAELAGQIEAARGRPVLPPIETENSDEDGTVVPSFAQERFWLLDQLQPGTALYNLPARIDLDGALDVAALHRAVHALVDRHEVLRSALGRGADGEVEARIMPSLAVPLPRVDLSALTASDRDTRVRRLAIDEARRPFHLEKAPLLRLRLLCLSNTRHTLLLNIHHAAADAASLALVGRQLADAYAGVPPVKPSVRYRDFARWQRRVLAGEVLDQQLAYWRDRLGDGPPVIELPVDRRPARPSATGRTLVRPLGQGLARRVEALAIQRGATPFLALVALFGAWLERLGAGADLPVGTPVANRRRLETETIIGCFVNTVVLRLDAAGRPSFVDALDRARREALAAFLHQDLPFERLVAELQPERRLGVHPFFQVLFTLQRPMADFEAGSLWWQPREFDFGIAKFDLTLVAEPTPEAGLRLMAEFRRDLFDDTTMHRLLGHFERLLAAALDAPETPLADLPWLAEAERHQLAHEWNDTRARAVDDVWPWFDAQAAVAPERTALVGADGVEIPFRELRARALAVGAALAARGLGPGDLVAILAPRQPETVIACLGALAAGVAYLPLQPSTPSARLAELLRDAKPALILGRPVPNVDIPCLGCDRLDHEASNAAETAFEPVPVMPSSPAYVIYTSGSTGRPKGVCVPRSALAHLARAVVETYRLSPADRVLQFAPLAFDVAVEELFPTWCAGAAVVLWDDDTSLEPRELLAWTTARQITVMNLPGSYWQEVTAVLDANEATLPASLRLMVTGSEAIAADVAARWRRLAPAVGWTNAYGVTEASVTSTCAGFAPGTGVMPIGRPLLGVSARVVEMRTLEPRPTGLRGELVLGGDGVASGYLGHPAWTAAAFVPDPLSPTPGARFYRTGDLARHLADGRLEFLGRADRQVKIRGFRIEPGEVEAALATCPGVAEAAVTVLEGDGVLDGSVRLAGGVTPASADLDAARDRLRQILPPYMVPSVLFALDTLPRTSTGKVDRNALVSLALAAQPQVAQPPEDATSVALDSENEQRVAEAFADVLGCEVASLHPSSDFFDLGGHSLAAIRVLARLRRELGLDIPLPAFFESPTVAGLAARLDDTPRRPAESAPEAATIRPVDSLPAGGPYPAAFSQERLWFLDHLSANSASYNLSGAFTLDGPLSVAALETALGDLVRRHSALRTVLAADGGKVVQWLDRGAPPVLTVVDRSDVPQADLERETERLARTPFDLRRGPLLRLALLRTGSEAHRLVLGMHHIISDAWSLDVFARELAALYSAAVRGEAVDLPEPERQYVDYAAWQRERGDVLEAQIGYWQRRLAGAPSVLDLPADRPRPDVPTFRGAHLDLAFGAELSAALTDLARRQDATLFMTLFAAFQMLIARWSGRHDFLLGTDVANRHRAETEGTIGFFVNSLPLRSDVEPGIPFTDFLRRVRQSSLAAFAHQDVPFHQLVQALDPERAASRNPLFQVMFILQNAPPPAPQLAGLRLEPHPLAEGHSVFDLTVSLEVGVDGAIGGHFRYSTELFTAATMRRRIREFENLLRQITERPDAALADFLAIEAPKAPVRRRKNKTLGRLTRRPKALDLAIKPKKTPQG